MALTFRRLSRQPASLGTIGVALHPPVILLEHQTVAVNVDLTLADDSADRRHA